MSQKKTYPLVSVIMNNHNGAKFLKKCKSVLNQSYKNWEIIFWDNFSKDESKQIIQNFKEKELGIFILKTSIIYINLEILRSKKQKENISVF